MNRKACLGIWAIDDRCTGRLAKVDMAAYKISMEMCFKDVFDLRIPFFRQFQIGINIPERIYNSCFTITFNVIGSFAQAPGIQLLDKHMQGIYSANLLE